MEGTKSADYKKKLKGTESSKRSFKSGTALESLRSKMPKGTKVPKDHLKTTALVTKSDAMYMPDADMDVREDYNENMSRVAKGNFSTGKALMEMKSKVEALKNKRKKDGK
jgi:hypothetical protein